VDIVVSEQRDKADILAIESDKNKKHTEEVFDENGKPFWMKFFKADYLE
jgi:hypothetical protein